MAKQQCEYYGECTIREYICYCKDSRYREIYCLNDFESCQRRKLRMQGTMPPDNMLPHGEYLPADELRHYERMCDSRLLHRVRTGIHIYWAILLAVIVLSWLVA